MLDPDKAADDFFRKQALQAGYRSGDRRRSLAQWYRKQGLIPTDRERDLQRREVPLRPET
jgi:hypothetical protein